jgi:hypothetical protein
MCTFAPLHTIPVTIIQLHFFVLVYFKWKIYFNRLNNLEDLRQMFRAEMEQISPDIIERSVGELVGGGQFQYWH